MSSTEYNFFCRLFERTKFCAGEIASRVNLMVRAMSEPKVVKML